MTRSALLIIISLTAFTACEGAVGVNNAPASSDDGEAATSDDYTGDTDTPDSEIVDAEVTYHRDIRPILQTHCTDCHTPGGIGPFALTNYEEVAPLATLLANSMSTGAMPPWPPADDCQEFEHARNVPAAEIALVEKWAELSAPEGDPADAPAANNGSGEMELGDADVTVDIGADYRPVAPDGGPDDHRCFVMDPELTETRFINTLNTRPQNLEIAHHMLLFAVPASAADSLAALESEDSDPGYDCFSGAGIPNASLVGGWVPGAPPMRYPDGAGIELPAGSLLVAQMHYNTLNDADGTDQTELDLHFVDGAVDTELSLVPFSNAGFNVPVGERMTVSKTMTVPADIELYGIAPHMHLFGEATRVHVSRNDDSTCLVDIPKWDFNWQGFYSYREPIDVPAGSEITLECDFDNRMENQPAGLDSPAPLTWGDGTYDEMCITYFVVAQP